MDTKDKITDAVIGSAKFRADLDAYPSRQSNGNGHDMSDHIDIVFDGPPSHRSGRFVEVEDGNGTSIRAGGWIKRDDGLWSLRILKPDPEDFIGACDPSLLSDSLPGQPKPRDMMRLPKRMDWDNGEMVPHSSGEYCEHENVCEILGERDAYIATLEAKLDAADRLAGKLPVTADGVPVVPQVDTCWTIDQYGEACCVTLIKFGYGWRYDYTDSGGWSQCELDGKFYATREAALTAYTQTKEMP